MCDSCTLLHDPSKNVLSVMVGLEHVLDPFRNAVLPVRPGVALGVADRE